MYTQCPHCSTLFHISSEELKAAAGKVRCCQCTQVFNALETLQENPQPKHDPAPATDTGDTDLHHTPEQVTGDDSLFVDTLNLDSEQLLEMAAADDSQPPAGPEETDELFLIRDDGLETEPDYLAGGSESQMSELLDSDSASPIIAADESEIDAIVVPINQQMDSDNPLEAHQGTETADNQDGSAETAAAPDSAAEKPLFLFTERQKDDPPAAVAGESGSNFQIDQVFEKQHSSFSSLLWGVASLLLILLLILQLSWQYRERVIQYEYGQQLLSQICRIAGCTPPERRDTSQIFIQHRDLRGHPGKPNALLLQLSMVNRADFAQPFPKLYLSLFNDRDKLISGRTFEPEEYLSDPSLVTGLMQQSEPTFISMELVDPGKDVTGFKFDFL